MKIRELFESKVTRDIPPVVYFHEQSAEKIADEVGEYIITGGYKPEDPRFARSKDGIHEEMVRLLKNLKSGLDKVGGPGDPACWISGYYGSGKSSFAKLLGLGLDGHKLPDGSLLSDALLARDTSPLAADLRDAWKALVAGRTTMAVAFDIGAVARDGEHVHSAIVRQVQLRLGYCSTSNLVASFELKLEIDRDYEGFLAAAARVLKKPWPELKHSQLADTYFSQAMHAFDGDLYLEPTTWLDTQSLAQRDQATAVIDSVRAIQDMLTQRAPGRTVFLVVDEVSQYVHDDGDRMLKLQSFVSELGQRLRGGAWLLATGQQKLDDAAGIALAKLKDRFPERLRVHLSSANIRDVVHRRLLKKKPEHERLLREAFQKYRPALVLGGYKCEAITQDDFLEVYPMLPEQIELLLAITTALRNQKNRAQGDSHAIRGLLQLLGELFREQKLADAEVGDLVTLESIYEVLRTSLDADVQTSLLRALDHCAREKDLIAARSVKAVALLELIQGEQATTAELVAKSLYPRLGHPSLVSETTEALERLRAASLLSYSEKLGFKLQSPAGQEWDRERGDFSASSDQISAIVREALDRLSAELPRPKLQGRPFPWIVFFSDGRHAHDVRLKNVTADAVVTVDFRWVSASERGDEEWIRRSTQDDALKERFLWVAGGSGQTEDLIRRLVQSRRMIERYASKRETLAESRRRLLHEEEIIKEELEGQLYKTVQQAFQGGTLYFAGRPYPAREEGTSVETTLHAFAEKRLRELYPQYIDISIDPREMVQLLQPQLTGPSVKFFETGLGILSLDAGRAQPTCEGAVPRRVFEAIKKAGGIQGTNLLGQLGRPPFGYPADVVQACVAGLLRAKRVRIEMEGGVVATSLQDPVVFALFDKAQGFRKATFFPVVDITFTQKDINRICTVLETYLGVTLDRESDAVANCIFSPRLDAQRERLRKLEARFVEVPGQRPFPAALDSFGRALEACRASRAVDPTVVAALKNLDALRDGFESLGRMESELDAEAVADLKVAHTALTEHIAQLDALGALGEAREGAERLRAHFAGDRPWIDARALRAPVERITAQYRETRKSLLSTEEVKAEAVRQEIKRRQGFERLGPDQAHVVLRPITEAVTRTTPEAVAPKLEQIRDGFPARLARAKEIANDLLDEALRVEEPKAPPIVKVDLRLHGRELETPAQLEALLKEIETRLAPLVAEKKRVRLV